MVWFGFFLSKTVKEPYKWRRSRTIRSKHVDNEEA